MAACLHCLLFSFPTITGLWEFRKAAERFFIVLRPAPAVDVRTPPLTVSAFVYMQFATVEGAGRGKSKRGR
jgi:hypothetical protein